MFILLHVVIAIASLALATYTYVSPSPLRLRASQVLIVSTLFSGTYLVVSTNSNLISACLTGIVYISAVSAATFMASAKLAKQLGEKV